MNSVKNIKFGLFLGLVFLFACTACNSVAYNVKISRDDFNKSTTYYVEDNLLQGSPNWERIQLNPVKYEFDNGMIFYGLMLIYLSDEPLCLEGGDSLILLIDGRRIPLLVGQMGKDGRISRTLNRQLGREHELREERGTYLVEPDVLRAIAHAKRVRVRIKGCKGYLDREFGEKGIERVKLFVLQQMPNVE